MYGVIKLKDIQYKYNFLSLNEATTNYAKINKNKSKLKKTIFWET